MVNSLNCLQIDQHDHLDHLQNNMIADMNNMILVYDLWDQPEGLQQCYFDSFWLFFRGQYKLGESICTKGVNTPNPLLRQYRSLSTVINYIQISLIHYDQIWLSQYNDDKVAQCTSWSLHQILYWCWCHGAHRPSHNNIEQILLKCDSTIISYTNRLWAELPGSTPSAIWRNWNSHPKLPSGACSENPVPSVPRSQFVP